VHVCVCHRDACMHACMCVSVRACVACVRACVDACVHACVHACVRVCVRACVCACVRVCVCARGRTHAVACEMQPQPRVRLGAQLHESKQEILSSLGIEFSEFSLRALKIYTWHTVSIMETGKT